MLNLIKTKNHQTWLAKKMPENLGRAYITAILHAEDEWDAYMYYTEGLQNKMEFAKCHQEVVRLVYYTGVLIYLKLEVEDLSRDPGGYYKVHKLQTVELLTTYYLACEGSWKVLERLPYKMREFCQQQRVSYTIETIDLYYAEV